MNEGETVNRTAGGAAAARMYEQVLRARVSPEALVWLADGFNRYDLNRGAITLERCLGLPSQKKRKQILRNYWICETSRLLGGDTPAERCSRLAAELDVFTRSAWQQWRHQPDPPPGTSELRNALFRLAALFGDRGRLSEKQMQGILKKLLVGEVSGPSSHS